MTTALVVFGAVLTAATIVAAYREAREADRREAGEYTTKEKRRAMREANR